MMKIRLDLVPLALSLSLLGTGCGDDGSADTDADASTSSATETMQPGDGSSTLGNTSVAGGSSSTGSDVSGSTAGTGGTGSTESSADTTSAGETEGEELPEGYVNCGDLPDDGPTLAPEPLGPLGFPEAACSPRSNNDGSAYTCCSDDPASLDGTPLFSGANNGLGTWGLCVRTDDLPAGSGLPDPEAANCPIPCNPTWGEGEVTSVCGAGRSCCQTREIQPEDCIQDDDGTWRPATGNDLLNGDTNWAPDRHATHQDGGGQGCATFAGTSDIGNPLFSGCLQQLGVADQRGYCLALNAGQACPGAGEPNACDLINMGTIPPPR